MDSTEPLEGGIRLHPLASDLHRSLVGAAFPLDRPQLVHVALENGAPRTLLTLLSGLPTRAFTSLEDVQAAVEELP